MKKQLIAVVGTVALLSSFIAPAALAAPVDYGTGAAGPIGTSSGLGTTDLKTSIAKLINVALGFLGILAVLIILYGGFLWMTATGDPKKVDKAKSVIIQGVIGLVIILSSWAIATFVIGSLSTATGQTVL